MGDEEITVLDLDWDLIQHLAIKDSFLEMQKEEFSEDLIEDDLARDVYFWQVKHYREHGEPAGPSVLEDEFDEVAIQEPQAAIGDLLARLRKRYIKNEGQDTVEQIGKLTIEDPLNVGKTMVAEGRRIIQITDTRGESFGPGDYDRAITMYDKKVTEGPGPTFGFTEIDQHFHGQKGVSVLLASPKSYKSWICTKASLSEAQMMGNPYIFPLELPAEDQYWRFMCMAADIPYWKYLHGSIEPDDKSILDGVVDEIEQQGNFRIEKPPPGSRNPHQLIEKAINADASCVFIDQLQYVEAGSKSESLGALNKTGYYFEVMNIFRDYSDHIPIFIVHQFNRTVMGLDGMPEMQQAKGSSAIEEVASLALAAWATKDMRASNVLNLGTNFSRHYNHATWEIDVELTRGCNFTLVGEVHDDEDAEE
jgi:hypothetical protein